VGLRKTVLVIDDDHDIRGSLSRALEDEGYTVELADNGKTALDALRAGSCSRPSLIFLDLMMPVMDGFLFRREQMCEKALADIPVVVLSADRNVANAGASLRAAASLGKPVHLYQLFALAEKYCT